MNKIFKVIWNKARNCYVVTSEIAKSHSKTKSETSKDRGYTLISTLAVLFLTGCVPVFAAVTDDLGPTDPNPARSAGIRLSSGWMSALEGGTATKMYDYGTPGNKAYDNTGVLQWDGTGRYQLYTGTHLYGIALGNAANAYDPEVQTASGTALGDYSRARSLAVAVGPYASAEKIAAVAIGAGAKAAEFNSLAMMRQSYASGKYAAAIGTAAVAKGEASLAMGHSSTATGNQSIAIGTIAPKTQYDSKGTPIAAYDGVNNTQATADRAIALGQTAHAKGVDSIAFGSRSTAGGASSIAYGTDAKACADNAVAIGKSASAPTVNGVALGSNSRADRTSGEWGYNVKTEDGRTNGYAGLGGSALRSEYAAVSVGNEGHTRQITHVAAGSKDTDAVNVAQLRNVNLKVGANTGHTDVLLDSQTLKIQGDNQYVTTQAGSGTVTVGLTDAVRQKIDASANINLSNITNEGKTVIHNEAQKAVVVKGGSNTTVTSTVANGTKTYTVNGRDTTVSAVPGSRITVKDNGGIDANGNRHYEIGFKDCDLAKKTDIWTLQANGKDVPPSRGKVNLVNGENVTIEKSENGQIRISAKGGHDEDAVHYDISNGVVNKNSVTMAGSTYVNKTGGTHITNVAYATGNDGSEVVNVDYLTDQVNNAVTNTTTNVTNNLTAKGMNFVGNDGQSIHKDLGSTLGIVGKNSNIQTANDNGKISIALAKNLTDITSVSNGNTSIVLNNNTSVGGNGVTITGGNVSVSNNRITNVQNGVDSHDAVNKGQLDSKVEEVTNKGLRFDANVGGEQTSALGSKVTVKGDGTNIKTSIKKTGADTVIDVALGKDVTAETVTVTGKNGKDGKIGINGKDGVDGINGTNRVDIHVEKGQPGVNGTDGVTRIVYEDKTGNNEVATLDDGMKFAGDNGTVISKKLNERLDVRGGAAGALSDGNIGVNNIGGVLKVQLAKEVTGLTSVTAGNVKTGTQVSGGVTGNYVTGLDNKTWNGTAVSGRAATEDQLKVLQDTISTQGAGATDYRLVENNTADKAYSVDADGKVNLTVEDKNHAGMKQTVTIKDVASKTAVDNLSNRSVQYDVTGGVVNKNSVTMAGSTYVNKTGGTHITNVAYATGNDGSEVVNVDYLTDQVNHAVTNTTTNITNNLTAKGMNFVGNDGRVIHKKLGETLGIVGGGTKADSEYSSENIKTVKDADGNISVMMDKNLVTESVQVGKDGKDGKIGVSGKDGKDAVTVYGKDGVGHIGLTGPAGTNGKDGTNGIDLTVKNGYDDVSKGIKGEKGVDGTDGITRIVYEDKTGEHQVATMEDGMVFGGDTGTDIIKKLNNKVSVIGGITNRTLLTTEDNIGVVSDGTDNLKVRLAKDLRGITAISNGDTKITLKDHCEDAVTITGGNINVTNNRITNLKDGEDEHDAVNKGQLDKAVDGIKQGAFGVTADDGKSVKKNLGETVAIGGDGANISTSVENGKVRVSLNKDVRVDTVTANKVTTGDTTVTSDGLVINGGPSVTKNGIDAGNKVITNVAAGRIGAGSTDAVNGGQLHDMADSISRKGFGVTADDGQSIIKGLGETVAIGGDGTNVRTSVSGGKVVVGLSDKLTIGNGAGAVSIDGVNGNIGVGGVSIGRQGGGSYVGGLSNTTWDVKNPNITSGRAATEDQLKVVSDKISGGRVFQGDWGKVSVGLGDTLNLRGNAKNLSRLTDGNIAVVSNSAQDGYNIKLAKDINMGDGTITFTTSTTAPESTPREMTNGPVLGEDRRPGAPTVTSSMTMGGSGITFTPVGTSTTGVSLTGTGLNNGGQQLHGVAAGILDDDAVNVSQLRRVQVKVDNAGSASAALAGLHSLAYDPIAPTQVMAAVGSYGNSTSVALGLAHYTNENTLLHVGASFGQQDNAVNAGVTYKFGRSAEKKAIPDRYKAGPISSVYVMQDEVTALKAENARIKHHEEELTEAYRKVQADNEEMKAQIALLMEKAGLK